MDNAYTKTPAEALRHFDVTEEKGLSQQQVATLRAKHGKNGTWPRICAHTRTRSSY
jgi:Ca2+ transporting ATPase